MSNTFLANDKVIYTRSRPLDDDYETELVVTYLQPISAVYSLISIGTRNKKPVLRKVETKSLRRFQSHQDKVIRER